GHCAGEIRVVLRRDPLGQHLARVAEGAPLRLVAIEELRFHDLVDLGDYDLAAGYEVHLLLLLLGRRLSEAVLGGIEGGEFPELLARPLRERVLVALGTLDLDAQEDAGRGAGEVLGLALVDNEEALRRHRHAALDEARLEWLAAVVLRGE